MDSLALVNLLPLMKRTSGKSEIVIGWIDGPILAESYPERESTCNKTKTLVNMKRITKSVKFPWLGSQIATLPLALLASIANAWALPLNTAYVANSGDSTVSVIALDTLTVVATIHVGSTPTYLAVLPDGSRVYVANRDSNDLSVINTSSGLVIKTIAVGTAPARLAVSRDGQHVYVPNSGSSDISVIETAANAVIATVPTPPEPTAIAFHPARDETWIGYGQIGTVIEVRSALDYSVLASLTSFSRLYGSGFAFRPDGSEVFAAESCGFCGRFHLLSGTPSGGSITIIQPDILFDNTGSAAGMAINPSSGIAYLAKTGQNGTPYIREFGGAGRTLTFPIQIARPTHLWTTALSTPTAIQSRWLNRQPALIRSAKPL